MKRKRTDSRELSDLSSHEIEVFAEVFKERIYATITLLAVVVTLWQTHEHISELGAAASIFGSAVALWLATSVSSRMSYRAIHQKVMPLREYKNTLRRSSALLIPAFPALFMIGLSAINIISLQSALLISIILLFGSFALFSLTAGLRIRSSWLEIIITSGFEIALGAGIVLLKIAAGH